LKNDYTTPVEILKNPEVISSPRSHDGMLMFFRQKTSLSH